MNHQRYALTTTVAGTGAERTVRISLTGEIDFEACEELTATFLAAVRDHEAARVIVDLERTTFIDSHGVAMFLAGQDAARQSAREFRLINARGLVQRVLEVTGVANLFLNGRA